MKHFELPSHFIRLNDIYFRSNSTGRQLIVTGISFSFYELRNKPDEINPFFIALFRACLIEYHFRHMEFTEPDRRFLKVCDDVITDYLNTHCVFN